MTASRGSFGCPGPLWALRGGSAGPRSDGRRWCAGRGGDASGGRARRCGRRKASAVPGATCPWVGTLVDRFGARAVTTGGSILFAASLAATGLCRNLWQLAIVYGALASLGLAATGPVVANAVVSHWFNKKRGTAVSLLGSASMTGMSLLVPAMAWMIVTVGWRDGLRGRSAGFVLVCMVPLVPVRRPRLARVDGPGPRRRSRYPRGPTPLPRSIRGRRSARRCARSPSGSSPARS